MKYISLVVITIATLWSISCSAQDTIFIKKGCFKRSWVLSSGKDYYFFHQKMQKIDTVARYRYARYENINISGIFVTKKYYTILYEDRDIIMCTVYKYEGKKWKPYFFSIIKSISNINYAIKPFIISKRKIILRWQGKKDIYKIDYKNQRVIPVRVRKKTPSEPLYIYE
jgi:hypothetical protein